MTKQLKILRHKFCTQGDTKDLLPTPKDLPLRGTTPQDLPHRGTTSNPFSLSINSNHMVKLMYILSSSLLNNLISLLRYTLIFKIELPIVHVCAFINYSS